MQKWEYLVSLVKGLYLYTENGVEIKLGKGLNQKSALVWEYLALMGEDGWEVTGVIGNTVEYYIFLRRPKG